MQILMTGWRTFPIRKIAKIFDVGAPTLNLTHLISSHLSSAIFVCRHRLDSIEWSGSEDRCEGRGKSELLRAAGWLTARRGDATESATENRPPIATSNRREARVK